MPTQSSLPNSIKASLSYVTGDGKPDLFCDWKPGAETCQKYLKCDEHPRDGCRNFVSTREGRERTDDSCTLIQSGSCSQLSTISTICASSAPNFVYKRRNLQRNSVALFSSQEATNTKRRGGCLSFLSSEGLSPAADKDHLDYQIKPKIDDIKTPVMPTDFCNEDLVGGYLSTCCQLHPQKHDVVPCTQIDNSRGLDVISMAESIIGYSVGEEHGYDKAPSSNVGKSALENCSVNDSCSSTKSDVELGSASTKIEMDDTGECSSSDILGMEVLAEDFLEKEFCISILRSQGLLEGVLPVTTCASFEVLGINNDSNCSQSCKICGHFENLQNMLICDHCEEAFHVYCCNPKKKKMPVDEWYCQPCLKKKCKLESAAGKSSTIRCEISELQKRTSKGESGPIFAMLNDTKPYISGVRVGRAFQVEVPDWSGPVSNDGDYSGELLEIDHNECSRFHGWTTNKSSTPSSIGNWLQCREVLHDNTGGCIEGTICGKWRRAPLFEAQTEDWDCSCAVLWDPIHSDCAVGQELETNQVLMHLKYIELLRPRLAAKKRKLSCTKSDGSEQL